MLIPFLSFSIRSAAQQLRRRAGSEACLLSGWEVHASMQIPLLQPRPSTPHHFLQHMGALDGGLEMSCLWRGKRSCCVAGNQSGFLQRSSRISRFSSSRDLVYFVEIHARLCHSQRAFEKSVGIARKRNYDHRATHRHKQYSTVDCPLGAGNRDALEIGLQVGS